MTIGRWLLPPLKERIRTVARYANHAARTLTDRQPKLLVLLYHRILPEVGENPFSTIVSVRTFVKQLESVARRYPLIGLGEAMDRHRAGTSSAKVQVVLTFDDGYWDNYDIVLPILRRHGWPATFLVVEDYLDGERPLWDWDVVMRLTRGTDIRRLELDGAALEQGAGESRRSFALRVIERLKSAPRSGLERLLAFLRQQSDRALGTWRPSQDRCLTWEQVRAMSQAGMEIGAHTCSHRSLSRLPLEEAMTEIRDSKAAIEQRLQSRCRHFAFPYGSRNDYNQALITGVQQAGFDSCLLNIHGYNHPAPEMFSLKRIIMTESTPLGCWLG